jgi:hypothetical protein
MRSSNGDLTHRQDWVQDGTLLDVFGDVVGIFHYKSKNGVSTNVLSKSNHTRGGEITEINAQVNPRIRLWFHLRKTRLYAKVHLKHFQNKLLNIKEHMVLVHTGSKIKLLPDSPSVVTHSTGAGHFPNNPHQSNHSQKATLVM